MIQNYGKPYIAHYGVKGMKWGVRNKDTRLSKNTSLYRVSSEKEIEPKHDRTYLAYTKNDVDFYKEHMTKFRRTSDDQPIFLIKYKNLSSIKHPSSKKQADEFYEFYKDHKVKIGSQIADEMVYRLYRNNSKEVRDFFHEKLSKRYSDLDDDEIRTKGYLTFMRTYSDLPISSLFQEQLKKKGYNSLLDDNDIINNDLDVFKPEKPIIVFEPSKLLKIVDNEQLSEDVYKKALLDNEERRKKVD